MDGILKNLSRNIKFKVNFFTLSPASEVKPRGSGL
jgi:hypothetical protein